MSLGSTCADGYGKERPLNGMMSTCSISEHVGRMGTAEDFSAVRDAGGIVQAPLAQLPWHHPEKIMFRLSANEIT